MISQAVYDTSADAMLLPVEILAHIFRAACCIDAQFHLALRRVSRLCHDIARPLKYCSMFIQGPEQLHVIVQQLAQYPANISLVEHVALTDHNHSSRRDTPGHESKPWPNRHPNVQMVFTARPEGGGNWIHNDSESVFVRDIRAFFDMVAPTLRTLHVSFYSPNLAMYFEIFRSKSSRTYPQLEELAYRGATGMGQEALSTLTEGDGIIPAVESGRTKFPQLRRLWFSGPPNYYDWSEQEFFSDLAKSCPGLIHLRLHEESAITLRSFLEQFMRWHGVRIGESPRLVFVDPGAEGSDWGPNLDTVSVLQTNALIGFQHLQRLIIDLQSENHLHRRSVLPRSDRGIIYALASRRREVVIRSCNDCPRGRAPLSFIRNLFERSVGGDPELWSPENKIFQEDKAKRWQPIRIAQPPNQRPLMYRANVATLLSEKYDWRLPSWMRRYHETVDSESE